MVTILGLICADAGYRMNNRAIFLYNVLRLGNSVELQKRLHCADSFSRTLMRPPCLSSNPAFLNSSRRVGQQTPEMSHNCSKVLPLWYSSYIFAKSIDERSF